MQNPLPLLRQFHEGRNGEDRQERVAVLRRRRALRDLQQRLPLPPLDQVATSRMQDHHDAGKELIVLRREVCFKSRSLAIHHAK